MRMLHRASTAGVALVLVQLGAGAEAPAHGQGASAVAVESSEVLITRAQCTAATVGDAIAPTAIGEPVSAVTLQPPAWNEATGTSPAHCRVNGSMMPMDTSRPARPILFSVALPATWTGRAVQLGGAGINGFVPNLTGGGPGGAPALLARGLATYGSDSGHQAAFGPPPGGRPGAPPGVPPGAPPGPPPGAPPAASPGPPPTGAFGPAPSDDWALNDEAIANLGYMQMKKTHDAAMVIIERVYGERPRFNYYIGDSQGGREALTVAQRYPADYDGISAERADRQLLDADAGAGADPHPGEAAGELGDAAPRSTRSAASSCASATSSTAWWTAIINNYMACRAIFDVTQGAPNRHPWAAKRCPNNVDPEPGRTPSATACLTDGQIATLELVYSPLPCSRRRSRTACGRSACGCPTPIRPAAA